MGGHPGMRRGIHLLLVLGLLKDLNGRPDPTLRGADPPKVRAFRCSNDSCQGMWKSNLRHRFPVCRGTDSAPHEPAEMRPLGADEARGQVNTPGLNVS